MTTGFSGERGTAGLLGSFKVLTLDEARRIAVNVAKLQGLVGAMKRTADL
jgi:hypothetical protein